MYSEHFPIPKDLIPPVTCREMKTKISLESDDAPAWMMLPHVKNDRHRPTQYKPLFRPKGDESAFTRTQVGDHGNMNYFLARSGLTDKPAHLPGHREELAKNPRTFFKATRTKGSMTLFAEERQGIEQCLHGDGHGAPTHPCATIKDKNACKAKPVR
jgi:hypothetical protein